MLHSRATNGILINDTLSVFACCCDIKVEGLNRRSNHLEKRGRKGKANRTHLELISRVLKTVSPSFNSPCNLKHCSACAITAHFKCFLRFSVPRYCFTAENGFLL